MALLQPELWVQGGSATFPSGDACTFFVAFRRNTDLTGSRVLMSRNWNGAAEGMVFYEDDTADNMAAAWFTGGGSTFDVTNLASRPGIGTACNGYLAMRSTGEVRAAYATIAAPTTWVSAETATPIGSHGSNNAMSLTSNANGALIEAQRWCGWNAFKSETDFNGEIYSTLIGNASDILFQIPMNDGDATSPWPTISGPVDNDATDQGGGNPETSVANFLADPPSVVVVGPAPLNVVVGATAAFSVLAFNTSGTVTYQWQDNSGGSFADIGGATGRTYTTGATTSAFQRRQYRCNVTDTNGTTTSSAVELTLSWHDVYLYEMPEDVDPDDVWLRDPTVVAAGSDINGTASITLDALTLAGTGALLILGSSSTTLGALTVAGTGALAIRATAAVTLGDATLAGTGALAIQGTATATLGDATLAATGALAIQAAAGITLEDLTLAGTGTLTGGGGITGTASITLADLTVAGAGALAIQATSAVALDALTVAGTGQLPAIGSLNTTLGDATLASTGQLAINAAASVTLADATLAATGTSPRLATATITLDDMTASGQGNLPILGTLSTTLQDVTLFAIGVDPNAGGGGDEVFGARSPLVRVGRLLST